MCRENMSADQLVGVLLPYSNPDPRTSHVTGFVCSPRYRTRTNGSVLRDSRLKSRRGIHGSASRTSSDLKIGPAASLFTEQSRLYPLNSLSLATARDMDQPPRDLSSSAHAGSGVGEFCARSSSSFTRRNLNT